MRIFATVSLLVFISFCTFPVFAAPRVKISDGILEGSVLRSRKGRDIFAFRGIPYARPPMGVLRFQPPQPPISWTGVRSATSDRGMCLQKIDASPNMTTAGSEDCLYMNVFTPISPNRVKRNASQRYAVMVWFHGGSWMSGSKNSSIYGPQYLLDHDIVLVTMNYRLGALGFLSTADNIIPGNYGLKDHVLALRWVQKNIAAFGGNPRRVTIMGESAGAVSVHFLMLSRLAEGVFHRAISQSGTTISPVSFNTAKLARDNAHRLARDVNCPTNTSEGLLQCLRTKDPREIIAKPGEWEFPQFPLIPFRPVMEPNHPGAFLTEDPNKLLQRQQFTRVPWLTGVTSAEGSVVGKFIYGGSSMINASFLDSNFQEFVPVVFGFSTDCAKSSRDDISRRIRQYYFGDRKIDDSTKMNVVNMSSDALFNFASATSVKDHLHARYPVYYYYFAYNGDVKNSSIGSHRENDIGVGHAEDLLYLFPVNKILAPNGTMSAKDFQMVDMMTTLWTNFAKFGNPTPVRTSQLPMIWKPVRTNSLENFIIKSPTDLQMSRDMFKDMMKLWSNFPCRAGLSRSSWQHNA